MRLIDRSFLVVLFVLLVAGCGGDKPVEPDLDLAPVTGTVTLDGKPLADANISFLFDGKPPKGFIASGAKSDSSGKFIIMTGSKSGTVAGRYKITVSVLRMPDGSPIKAAEPGMDADMLRRGGQLKEIIPDRYNNPEITELSAAIPDGGTEDLELKLTGS